MCEYIFYDKINNCIQVLYRWYSNNIITDNDVTTIYVYIYLRYSF